MPLHPRREHEITLSAASEYLQPYVDLDVWAEFTEEGGAVLRRPAFWDGGRTWRIRFAAPSTGRWTWRSYASVDDSGLAGQSGELMCVAGPTVDHRPYQHGFWRMSPGGRSLVH